VIANDNAVIESFWATVKEEGIVKKSSSQETRQKRDL